MSAPSHPTNGVVAIKHLKFDFEKEGFPLEALREITLLSSLRHPNIVTMHAVACGEGDAPCEWHLVMEPAGHELTTLVKGARRRPFSEAQVKHLLLQLLRGLAALHSVWVMHRDLKTPNVLVDDQGVLKLCDFGLARRVCCGAELDAHLPTDSSGADLYAADDEISTAAAAAAAAGDHTDASAREGAAPGSASSQSSEKASQQSDESSRGQKRRRASADEQPRVYATHTPNVISGHYRPPEILLGTRDYGRSVDIWSAACIFGELLARQVVFAGKDEPDQLRQIFTLLGEPSCEEWPLYPHLAKARGFRLDSGDGNALRNQGGSDALRRRFPAAGFDGTHAPLTAMSLVTPLAHVTTSLSNTGFSLLSRMLECCPERRLSADNAKRDRWFQSRPTPEALSPSDIGPLLQLARIADVAPTPQFAQTGFNLQHLPPQLAHYAVGHAGLMGGFGLGFGQMGMAHGFGHMQAPTAASMAYGGASASVAAALAIARARALALANTTRK